jgi:integrase
MNAIVPIPSGTALPAALAPDLTRAAELAREEKAASTRRAYRSDFRIFQAWCRDRGVSALPAAAETVAAFLAHDVEAGSRPSTLGRRVSAIRYAHKLAGHPAPTDDERVKATMRGIRRTVGTAPRKKTPATADRIVSMAFATGTNRKGLRDRAVLLMGFAGAFRRSELVALNVEDLEESELGFQGHHPAQQDRSGGRRPDHRHHARQRGVPCRRLESMARGRRHQLRRYLSLGQERRRGGRTPARPIGCRHRKDLRRARRARPRAVRGPLHAIRISDERREAWRLDFQDDGPITPPVRRDAARLRPRCGNL